MDKRTVKSAFTLAEVLITLVIIGVVAALTVPTLMQKYQTKETVSRLRIIQNTLSNALTLAIQENGDIKSWKLGSTRATEETAQNLYNYFKPYLDIAEDCGTNNGCWEPGYKNLIGTVDPTNRGIQKNIGKAVLKNGMLLSFYSEATGCQTVQNLYPKCGSIVVDINGKSKPNQYGIDTFAFNIDPSGVIAPMNDKVVKTYTRAIGCSLQGTLANNGVYCTAWVLQKENMDYLHKDISWD